MFGFGKKAENSYQELEKEQKEAIKINKEYDEIISKEEHARLISKLESEDSVESEAARAELKDVLQEALKKSSPEKVVKGLGGRMARFAVATLAAMGISLAAEKSEGASVEGQDYFKKGEFIEQTQKGELEKDWMHWPIVFSPHFDWEGIKSGNVSPVEIAKFVLEPAAVALRRTGEQKGTIDADNIFQEYARKFDLANSLNPEDFEKTSKALEQQLIEELASRFVGLSWDRAAFEKKYPEYATGEPNFKATAVRIFATASPEGPAQRGPQTLEPGNIDPENIKLAEARAEEAKRRLIMVFDRLGIEYDESKIATAGSEIQFLPEEREALKKLATEYGKSEFEMVVDFNDGKLKETAVGNDLEVLLAEKRNASVEIDIEGRQTETLIIPLPLILLLLFRRRLPEDVPPPEEPEGPEVVDYDMLKEENRWLYEEVAKEMSSLSDAEILDRAKSVGQIETMATDWKQWEKAGMNGVGAGVLVEKMFEKWNWLDNEKRAKKGEIHEDHRNRPSQWMWSILHAIAERRLILEQRSTKKSIAETLADPEVRKMMIEDINEAINDTPELKAMVRKVRSGEWK